MAFASRAITLDVRGIEGVGSSVPLCLIHWQLQMYREWLYINLSDTHCSYRPTQWLRLAAAKG